LTQNLCLTVLLRHYEKRQYKESAAPRFWSIKNW
jgi:hypothetical protein